jgi:uncharacterized Zn-binding protein involved in type VI secretion
MATKAKSSRANGRTTAATQPPKVPGTEVSMQPSLRTQRMRITVVGDSSLISHAWGEKAKEMMLAKQMKEATGPKEAKDPERDFWSSLYIVKDHPERDMEQMVFGFPAVAFKSAAVDACSHVDGITKVLARGSFHINGDMVAIQGDKPVRRQDMVRVGMGTADIRFRGEFRRWWAHLDITYNAGTLSEAQIIDLFNTGGFAVGVGEWRPEKNGSFGRFHVATLDEVQELSA